MESVPTPNQPPAPAPAPRAAVPPNPVPPRAITAQGKGDSTIAAVLSWLIPGAGHIYLGQAGLGIACFVVVQGLYLLGLKLGQGMSFEYLDLELRSPISAALCPELGNLGAFFYQMQHYGFGPGFLRPFPDWLRLGSSLAALSGVLNIAVIAHAHWCARTAVRAKRWTDSAPIGVLATWFVPGLGHWIQGRRKRAIVVFLLLVGLFALGTLLAEATNLSRERHFYYWSGQFFVGLPALASELLWGHTRVHSDIRYVDAGLVFGCIAGLLNTLAMIDVYGFAESKLLGLPLRSSHASAEAQA